jgi:hypothetical protein
MMKRKLNSLCLVERLTLISLMFYVLPYMTRQYSRHPHLKYKVYFIDATRWGRAAARFVLRFRGVLLEKLAFRLVDIKDDDGNLLRLRIAYFDFQEIQGEILRSPVFKEALDHEKGENSIPTYLAKQTAASDLWTHTTVSRALLLVQIAIWKAKKDGFTTDGKIVLFMRKRPWREEIRRYAAKNGVDLICVKDICLNLKDIVFRLAGNKIKILRSAHFYLLKEGPIQFLKKIIVGENRTSVGPFLPDRSSPGRIAVEYYGHLNLDHPELNSDLFFWQQTGCLKDNILLVYHLYNDPLDEAKWVQMKKHGIEAVALNPRASSVASVPVFYHWAQTVKARPLRFKTKTKDNLPERKWLSRQVSDYHALYNYWLDFFIKYNAKIYLTWYVHDAGHCALADALRSRGGVMAAYQRSVQEFPSRETAAVADIFFSFSKTNVDLEKRAHSMIGYHVVTGYLGDHRFELSRPMAQQVRNALKKSGAQTIIAFFDEGSMDDARWHTGHQFMRENYQFLLEKLLANPWLGLVLKSKVPISLERRLGPVAELLRRARQTGRCYIFEAGSLHGSYPPAVAALSADISVHGHMAAVTAGMEAALAGSLTLLLDREGWPVSPLYRLGKGRVVFTDWPSLWNACQEHWKTPGGVPGFGDWSSMVNEFDPFRDGRAAERMGMYLRWIQEGLNSGLDRATALADAAERYGEMWGFDKVVEMTSGISDRLRVEIPTALR